MPPIRIRCPLCERAVDQVVVTRDYYRRGLNITVWTHSGGLRCFIADDLYEDPSTLGDPDAPFEIVSPADNEPCSTS